MYNIGDKVAHPMHGAGIIKSVEYCRAGGEVRSYYVIQMVYSSMKVMVPCGGCRAVGVRAVIGPQQAEDIILHIKDIKVQDTKNWSLRYKENIERIKSGDLLKVAEVVKSLTYRDREKPLSTGERKMLSSARQILVSELALAKGVDIAAMENIITRQLI